MSKVILASQSIGRKMLFEKYFKEFEVYPSKIDEGLHHSNPRKLVVELSIAKAKEVGEKFPLDFVCAFDTIVVCKGKIIGKPKDLEEARKYLRFLSGKIQVVYSGFCILNKEIKLFKAGFSRAILKFKNLSDEWIDEYVKTHPVTLFAGGYAIQKNDSFIKILWGEWDTIVGAPMNKVIRILKKFVSVNTNI